MNGQAITADDLLSEIKVMEAALSGLKKKVLSLLPPQYGSDAWWEKETKKSLEDYKEGRYVTLKNKNDIDKFFANL